MGPNHPSLASKFRINSVLIISITGLIVWGPIYRTVLDKFWALFGGMALVGQWAQLQTMSALIAAPAFLGIGMGLTVLTAQKNVSHHPPLLLAGCLLGLGTSLPILLGTILFSDEILSWLKLAGQLKTEMILILIAGWLSITFGQLSSYWLGKKYYLKLLCFTLLMIAPGLLMLLIATILHLNNALRFFLYIEMIAAIFCTLFILKDLLSQANGNKHFQKRLKNSIRKLSRYLPAGLSIGLLTPISGLVVRSVIAQKMDWETAGIATSLWRISDWVLSPANSILYLYFLPQLSRDILQGRGIKLISRIALKILIPSAIAFFFLFLFKVVILAKFYSPNINLTWNIYTLFWIGDYFRIISAVFLMGLYAIHAAKAIAYGELLSQPLFALITLLTINISLSTTGLLYAVVYLVYASFCIFSFAKLKKLVVTPVYS